MTTAAMSIVFVSEIDEDLGFNPALTAIANATVKLAGASQLNVEPIFFVRDSVHAGHEIAASGYSCLPAPTQINARNLISRGGSYASTLLEFGFSYKRDLDRAVRSWDSCLERIGPQLIVASNSPIACLAARGRYDVVVVGNGFTLPPSSSEGFPSPSSIYEAPANQGLLLETINAILDGRGVSPIQALAELVSGKAQALLTLSLLDPFRALRTDRGYGPITGGVRLSPPVLSPTMLLTLPSSHPGLSSCGRAAERCGISTECYAFGPETIHTAIFARRGWGIFTERPPLQEVLARSRFVVSGDLDVIQAAVIAGRPSIICPGTFQDSRAATELMNAGVALKISGYDEEEIIGAFEDMMADLTRIHSAQELARRIAQALPDRPAEEVVAELCMQLLE